MRLIESKGQATLYRKESYNHRTTPLIEWIVKVGEQIVRECNTQREAIVWLNIYAS